MERINIFLNTKTHLSKSQGVSLQSFFGCLINTIIQDWGSSRTLGAKDYEIYLHCII